MKVCQLAESAGVSRDTVRHYTRLGLIRSDRDPENGYRYYGRDALARVRFIKLAQQLGFKLPDIEVIFGHADEGESPCPDVRRVIGERLVEGKARVQELIRLLERMERALNEWQSMPDSVPDGHSICRLIESQVLDGEDSLNG